MAFPIVKATRSAENVLIIEEVFASSWLQIDPIRSTMEVDDSRKILKDSQRKWPTWASS